MESSFFIDESLDYRILEKTSNEAFQVLWTEFSSVNKKNVICSLISKKKIPLAVCRKTQS